MITKLKHSTGIGWLEVPKDGYLNSAPVPIRYHICWPDQVATEGIIFYNR